MPVMSLCGVAGFICTNLALWPIFGLLTPFYLLIIFFGASLSMTFLPGGACGTLLFWILFLVAGYISHTMPHEPH